MSRHRVVGVTLYGALDCTKGWAYDASKKTALTATADAVPLTLSASATGAVVSVFDFAITAADASAAGGSSIAVLANGVTATLTRVDLVAGKGADGAVGVAPAGSGHEGRGCGHGRARRVHEWRRVWRPAG